MIPARGLQAFCVCFRGPVMQQMQSDILIKTQNGPKKLEERYQNTLFQDVPTNQNCCKTQYEMFFRLQGFEKALINKCKPHADEYIEVAKN